MRQREARTLLLNRHFSGAYYLIGYSIECALKAAIARQINKHDFPDKNLVLKAYSHELTELLKLAGLKPGFDAALSTSSSLTLNWTIVKDWSVESRYRSNISRQTARDMYFASVARNGILPWIRTRW